MKISRSLSTSGIPAVGTATFIPLSRNRKLSPVILEGAVGRPRPIAHPPFVSATYASIEATCLSGCPFKVGGCYVRSGFTNRLSKKLDAAARGFDADAVISAEAELVDRAFPRGVPQDGARGGRDLRLHVGGDVASVRQAEKLGCAAQKWRGRGGGRVWTFTHAWRTVPRSAWGPEVSVLASVETARDIERASKVGYASAIVVQHFPSTKAFRLEGASARIVPCPAETSGRTCVECRLCLDADRLLATNTAIAFAVHGPRSRTASEVLVQLQRKGQARRKVSP